MDGVEHVAGCRCPYICHCESEWFTGGYYPTKRRRATTHMTTEEEGTAQKKQVDDNSGRGRVALENTIVVGRVKPGVHTTNGENRHGATDRRDAGRPPREPG